MIRTTKPEMDAVLPATWKKGLIKHFNDGDRVPASFFYEDETRKKYDLPSFMEKFANRKKTLLCREYHKEVGEKTYSKLIVIAVRDWGYEA